MFMAAFGLLGGGDKRERVDSVAPEGKLLRDDAFNPKPDQGKILERVRLEAEAEALRHAEAMVDREFPIVEEAESIGSQRIAALGAAYAALRSRLDAEIDAGVSEVSAAQTQLESTEKALLEQGVTADLLPLAPLGDGMASYWQVAPVAAVAAGAGVAVAGGRLSPLASAAVIAGALVLAIAILSLRIGNPESGKLTCLRRNRAREGAALEELKAELERNRSLAQGLVRETLRLVEAEEAFAKQIVATYESAASSALPVGALGDGGRAIRKQRAPSVAIPPWVRELEEAE
jgi:hypothetical protein